MGRGCLDRLQERGDYVGLIDRRAALARALGVVRQSFSRFPGKSEVINDEPTQLVLEGAVGSDGSRLSSGKRELGLLRSGAFDIELDAQLVLKDDGIDVCVAELVKWCESHR